MTHDRYFLDNVAQWILELDRGRGIPWKGNYSSLAGAEASSGWQGGETGIGPAQGTGRANWNGRTWRRGPRRQEQGPSERVRKARQPRRYEEREDELVMQIPPGPHLGDLVVRAENVRKGYGDNLLMEDLNFDLPRGGIVGVIGPNGAGKTTLFRMIVGQEKPDERHAARRRYGGAGLRRSEPRHARRHEHVFEEITGGVDYLMLGKRKVASRGYVSQLQLQGAGPAAQGRRTVRRRAQSRPPGEAAAPRRQPAAAGRTDERSGRRHAAVAGGGAVELRRLCGGHQPRSLVSGPHRHAHPGVRGRQQDGLVRGQLPDLRSAAQAAARRRGRPAAPHQVQETPSVG